MTTTAELEARRKAQLQGKTYISPYNDLDVVAGQGTIGVELARQAPDLAAVFVFFTAFVASYLVQEGSMLLPPMHPHPPLRVSLIMAAK